MPVRGLQSSRVLSTERFADAESYQAHQVLGGGASRPLDRRHFSASRATLALRDGLFVFQRSFARRLEADLGTDQGLGLIIPIDYQCNINGRDLDGSTIGLMRGKTAATVVEQRPNTYLMVRFNSHMRQRGWPESETALQYFRAENALILHLRSTVLEMFSLASASNDLEQFETLNKPLHEALLTALDEVFATAVGPRRLVRSHAQYCRLAARLDEYVEYSGSAALYSDEIAQAVGVSVRTLQTAMQVAHGMSLHRYLRLKRMWLIRKQLATGMAGVTVKSLALANGFSHMGEFSQAYKSLFGESPSFTIARSR